VFVVCSAADHPLAKRRRLTMAELANEQWALSVPSVLNVQHLHRTLQASGLPPPRVAIEARPLRLRLQICASTRLLSFNARRALQLFAPRFRLKELPVKELKWHRSVGVIYRKESYLSPAARRLIHLLKTSAPQQATTVSSALSRSVASIALAANQARCGAGLARLGIEESLGDVGLDDVLHFD
jgi:DNA-binding transcriptional LysR family regulator